MSEETEENSNVFLALIFIGVLFVLSFIFEKIVFPLLDRRKKQTEVMAEPEI